MLMKQWYRPNGGRIRIPFHLTSLLLILLCIFLVGCETTVTLPTTSTPSSQGGAACQQYCGQTQGVKIFVQPDAGEKVITDAIANAKRSIWVKVYLLTDRQVIDALNAAAKKGKEVRVMLEEHPFGGGGLTPRESSAL